MRGRGTPPGYHAYLLRLWEEPPPGGRRPGPWRYSLEDPHTGRRTGFGTLAALVAFLEAVSAVGGDGLNPALADGAPAPDAPGDT